MQPILFTIKGFSIQAYGAMAALGFIAAVLWCSYQGQKRGYHRNQMIDFCIACIMAAVLGARLGYVIVEWPRFVNNPIEILYIQQGGLVWYTGLIGGFTGGTLYVLWKKLDFWWMADTIMVSVCLSHVFGRIGCYLYGCCYGMILHPEHSLYWMAVRFPNHDVDRLPIQLISSCALLLIYFLLVWLYQKNLRRGSVFLVYIGLYGLIRFCLEYFRDDPRGAFLGTNLTTSQGIAIIAMITASMLWNKRPKQLLQD